MRILVNALPLMGVLTGIQRYVRCLYRELETLAQVSVGYFTGPKCLPEMPAEVDPELWSRRAERLWRLPPVLVAALRVMHWVNFERRLRAVNHSHRFDIYHETTSFPPAITGVPVVYTLYDLSLIKHREKHPRERVWFFDFFFKRRLPYAAHVLTISNFMRQELIEELGLPADRVTAVPLAAESVFYRRGPAEIARVLERGGWPREYILFVGTLEPRKNLGLLIQALVRSRQDIPLLLVGWRGWGEPEWWCELARLGLQDRVICTGYVDEESLACLYSGAAAFVYPSWYEGFGLPVLEAMACGCPVICTNTSSLPEVAGGAAILVDPEDPEALAHALDTLLADDSVRQTLSAQGLLRATEFSWEKTATKTLEVFAKVAGYHDSR